MLTPTARLLELLELLQAQPLITGREIADRLEIDSRTVRRYVEALQNLGIPVEGQRGVGGGYRIRPGYRLPPLMLTDDEAVAVALGVQAAGRLGLSGSSEAVDGALLKIHRVLPDGLRRRVEALEATLDFTSSARRGAPVRGETVLLLADDGASARLWRPDTQSGPVTVRGLDFRMSRRAGRVRTFNLSAKIGRDTPLIGDIRTRVANGKPVLYIETNDAGALFRFTERIFDLVLRGYAWTLRQTLRFRTGMRRKEGCQRRAH